MLRLIVVMGVSGSGKTLVGNYLAQQLGIEFVDGDTLHPEENVARMRAGIPMDDESRQPWLAAICQSAETSFADHRSLVIACSALKSKYRAIIRAVSRPVIFVFLTGAPSVIQHRLEQRTGHYMPASLLESQLADLDDPTGEPNVVTVEIGQSIDSMLREALVKTNYALANIAESDG